MVGLLANGVFKFALDKELIIVKVLFAKPINIGKDSDLWESVVGFS